VSELKKFIQILEKAQSDSGPHEAAFELLEELAKGYPEILDWVLTILMIVADMTSLTWPG